GEVARYYTYDMHTRIPDILLMSTLTLEKLTPEQQRIVEAAIKASIEFEKAAWDKEIEKTRLAAVKDFNVEFYEIDKKPFQKAVQPIYDGLKNKPRLYGLYQRIQTAKN
ncbi:TRAP transporter substrate-binding protein, partial [Salmonella enterica subsp. enterica serovar Montevideo]|nr:TRAP transporter substrate-binding protein [Salmonella enterica subsp. enterica serovar Montevideo]